VVVIDTRAVGDSSYHLYLNFCRAKTKSAIRPTCAMIAATLTTRYTTLLAYCSVLRPPPRPVKTIGSFTLEHRVRDAALAHILLVLLLVVVLSPWSPSLHQLAYALQAPSPLTHPPMQRTWCKSSLSSIRRYVLFRKSGFSICDKSWRLAVL